MFKFKKNPPTNIVIFRKCNGDKDLYEYFETFESLVVGQEIIVQGLFGFTYAKCTEIDQIRNAYGKLCGMAESEGSLWMLEYDEEDKCWTSSCQLDKRFLKASF